MDFKETFKKIEERTKNFIEYLRGLEDKQKKIILWTIVVILGLIMGYFWIRSVMYKLEKLHSTDFSFPQIETTNFENQTQLEINNLSESQDQINNQ